MPSAFAFLATRPAPMSTLGFEVFVQLVIAAITTEPCVSIAVSPRTATCTAGATAAPPPFALFLSDSRLLEVRLHLREHEPVLRPLRPGERGLDLAEIERERLRVRRLRRRARVEEPLLLHVRLDELHLLLA